MTEKVIISEEDGVIFAEEDSFISTETIIGTETIIEGWRD